MSRRRRGVRLVVKLGPFELGAFLGQGGMGRVYQARHAGTDTPAAIKLVSGEYGDPGAFRREVQAIARLDHPGVVRVYDYGFVSRTVELPDHMVRADTPWFAMELASRGLEHREVTDWQRLVSILDSVLAALAHCHARDVVHRDLKPANILVVEGATDVYKLTDFGISALDAALRARPEHERGSARGTPLYMAPEQITGAWRDLGPWTDLYALGAVAWHLATGAAPFRGQSVYDICAQHMDAEPPRFLPRFAVPRRLEPLLRTLLEKTPDRRFEFAADVRDALRALSGQELQDPEAIECVQTSAGLDASGLTGDGFEETQATIIEATAWTGGTESGRLSVRDWVDTVAPEPQDAGDIGLGLFGLRHVPLVSRAQERAMLQQALAEVTESAAPQAVVIRGRAGTGKSRLAEWLCRSAHEFGMARVLRARHAPGLDGMAGLVSMVENAVRAREAPRDETHDIVLDKFRSDEGVDIDGLAELLRPAELHGPCGVPVVRLSTPRERRQVIVSTVTASFAATRPLVIWLDDVQWSLDAIAFAAELMRTRVPVLVLATVRDELLAHMDDANNAVLDLVAMDKVRECNLGPLSDEEMRVLVEAMLPVEPETTLRVQEAAGGQPLFAIQLLSEWVERGALVHTDAGYGLREGEDVPTDLDALWRERLDRITGGNREVRVVLELAAVLGLMVRQEEWTAVAAEAQIDIAPATIEAMIEQRLAVRDANGWSFVHGAIRDALLSWLSARDQSTLHLACAQGLSRLDAIEPQAGRQERIGEHFFAGGRQDKAAPLLLRAAERRLTSSDYSRARALIARHSEALEHLPASAKASATGANRVVFGKICSKSGDLDEARQVVEEIRRLGVEQDALGLRADAEMIWTLISLKAGTIDAGITSAELATALYDQTADPLGGAEVQHLLGALLKAQGRQSESAQAYRHALTRFEAAGDRNGVGKASHGLANTLRNLGHLEEAERVMGQARHELGLAGNRAGVAWCANGLGGLCRKRGEMDAAAAHYVEAATILSRLGSRDVVIPHINRAMVHAHRGEFEPCAEILRRARAQVEADGRKGYLAAVEIELLPALAHQSDWTAFDASLERGRRLLVDVGMKDEDIAWAADRAADIAGAAGETLRASRARAVAEQQREALKRMDP